MIIQIQRLIDQTYCHRLLNRHLREIILPNTLICDLIHTSNFRTDVINDLSFHSFILISRKWEKMIDAILLWMCHDHLDRSSFNIKLLIGWNYAKRKENDRSIDSRSVSSSWYGHIAYYSFVFTTFTTVFKKK